MMGIIAARPASFTSPSAAISWSLRGGMCRSKDAAAVSLPSQLTQVAPPETHEHSGAISPLTTTAATTSSSPAAGEGGHGEGVWVWRTPLVETQPYWEGWYRGLSEAFLKVGTV